MLYHDHGLGRNFNCYDDYFSPNTDIDAIIYLKIANTLAHLLKPECITIAEDMSGLPGIARPVDDGGVGFDARLSMGLPDLWVKTMKNSQEGM